MPRFKATPQQLQWIPVEDDTDGSEADKDSKTEEAANPTDNANNSSSSNLNADKVSIEDLTALYEATQKLIVQLSAVGDSEKGGASLNLVPVLPKIIPPTERPQLPPDEVVKEPADTSNAVLETTETTVEEEEVQCPAVKTDEDKSKMEDLTKTLILEQRRFRDSGRVECGVCRKLMRRGSLREHMDRHNNSGKFSCSYCGKTFSRSSAREKHIRTHTGERPFKCDLCSKAYRQRVHLKEHMRSHTGVRPYICRLCGFSLASKSLLNRHLRTHGIRRTADDAIDMWFKSTAPKDEVLNIAAEVGRTLAARQALEELHNMALANNEEMRDSSSAPGKPVRSMDETKRLVEMGRRYLCSVCPAGFPTVQALRSHRMTTHGDSALHNCDACGMSFPSVKQLRVHLRIIHPQVCPICSQVMSERRRWMLEAHIREMHPEVSVNDVLGPPLSPDLPPAVAHDSRNPKNVQKHKGSSAHTGKRRRLQSGHLHKLNMIKRRRDREDSSATASSGSSEEDSGEDLPTAVTDSDGEFIEEDELTNESDEAKEEENEKDNNSDQSWGKGRRGSRTPQEPVRVQPTRIQPARSSRQTMIFTPKPSLPSSSRTGTLKVEISNVPSPGKGAESIGKLVIKREPNGEPGLRKTGGSVISARDNGMVIARPTSQPIKNRQNRLGELADSQLACTTNELRGCEQVQSATFKLSNQVSAAAKVGTNENSVHRPFTEKSPAVTSQGCSSLVQENCAVNTDNGPGPSLKTCCQSIAIL